MQSALALLALLALAPPGSPAALDFAAVPAPDRLRSVKLRPGPGSVLPHRFEERGFVTVPMDYARRAESPALHVFYRLMPARGSSARDPRAPILVVVNGGPGEPSSIYRPYDHDYERTAAGSGHDLLANLSTRFRVLIADQRGTPGYSSALDTADPGLDPAVVARYFDSVHHALDLQEVIRAAIPEGEPFYMLAQSYGGLVGVRYATMPEITRLPRGLILASAVLPNDDVVGTFRARRIAQRQLNLQFLRAVPEARELLHRLRTRFGEAGLDPGSVHYLWPDLGRGPAGSWEPRLRERVEALLQADAQGLRASLDGEAIRANLLNYILSAKELTPGFTDRTLATVLTRAEPFEDWMIDEQWTLSRIQGDGIWVLPLLEAIDRAPPALAPAFPALAEARRRLARVPVLFTLGDGDAFIGAGTAHKNASALAVEGRSRILTLPGGHRAAFLPTGVEAIATWIAGLASAPRR